MTVQDSRFRTSYLLGGTRLLLLLPIVGGPLGLTLIIFPPLALVLALSLEGTAAYATFTVAAVTWAFVVGFAVRRFLARRGLLTLKGPGGLKRAERELERTRRRRRSFAGIQVIKCSDANWRPIVEACLDAADAVVLDVTELTDNLVWELHSARRRLPPESILLVCANSGSVTESLPESTQVALADAIGMDELARHFIVYYPHEEERAIRHYYSAWAIADRRRAEDLAGHLATCIAFKASLSTDKHGMLTEKATAASAQGR
jgi:hypothetical protein